MAVSRHPRNRIRELREKSGLTQEQLAVASGVSHGTISRLDAKPSALPSIPTSVRLAQVLGVPLADILYFDVV
jgi:transcriptional regulator with XRE-family HTH domain